jgi:indole-3-glycerol phosphate synthase / phosphoribosylanthranilate isomerase
MTILDTIVESKRTEFPQFEPREQRQTKRRTIEKSDRLIENPFVQSLKRSGISIIGEVKPSSPSAGKLLTESRLPEILRLYKKHCAAISVLTDEKYFGGSFELLANVKQTTGLPVLCKDFIISAEQIDLAKKHGADAVLLIAKILDIHHLSKLVNTALQAGLAPVVEINNLSDLKKIENLPIEIVLINNRDLDTMKIDLGTTETLSRHLSEDTIIISASGIKTSNDIEKLLPSARRFLIGTSLMQSQEPGQLLDELQAVPSLEPVRRSAVQAARSALNTQVKICGITNVDDAELAIEAGADFIGLIFVPNSKRKISLETAKEVLKTVEGRVQTVGVFQNQNLVDVNSIAEALGLNFIQLHGAESSDYASACARPVIKAFEYSAKGEIDVKKLLQYSKARHSNAQYILFDLEKTNAENQSGQSSNRFNVLANLINPIKDQIPPFFLAGKLSTENVQSAIESLAPFAIDVASGIELSPGVKSEKLTKHFCSLSNRLRFDRKKKL